MAPERVLVVYASDQGSTREIADFIGMQLRVSGFAVDVRVAGEQPDASGYDAVVLGSAVHDRALLASAERFARRNAEVLRARPVWLFTVGIGPSLRGPVGGLLRRMVPPKIARVRDLLAPRDYHAFAGVVSRSAFSAASRAVLELCGGRYGDLRDWRVIGSWAAGIAADLRAVGPVRPGGGSR
ncbi:MAG TPA: flavodoxin domain-containing protein [Actinophytocola sp.]|jgi:menaquinone-dependent protoporphyrinogen oxidase|uniref:flavodoxin domain-containing protein n=1 Tax=Actinophytocola sp. TaxID=1872138 RepID=UPI002F9269BB